MSSSTGESGDGGPWEFLRQSLVTGTAVMLPLLVTLLVLQFVVNFVSQQLDPVVQLVSSSTSAGSVPDPVVKLVALLALLLAVVLVGVASESGSIAFGGSTALETIVARVPGIGSLYQGVDEMSRVLLDNDTDSFQEVKLVEFPTAESYSLAFLTAETPDVVANAVDHDDMVTVYLPLAPNPVMGGYVLHVDADNVYDVDLTVEEGIQSIVTSGVATGRHREADLSEDMLDRLNRRLRSMGVVSRVEDIQEYAHVASEKLGATAPETMPGASITEDHDDSEGKDR